MLIKFSFCLHLFAFLFYFLNQNKTHKHFWGIIKELFFQQCFFRKKKSFKIDKIALLHFWESSRLLLSLFALTINLHKIPKGFFVTFFNNFWMSLWWLWRSTACKGHSQIFEQQRTHSFMFFLFIPISKVSFMSLCLSVSVTFWMPLGSLQLSEGGFLHLSWQTQQRQLFSNPNPVSVNVHAPRCIRLLLCFVLLQERVKFVPDVPVGWCEAHPWVNMSFLDNDGFIHMQVRLERGVSEAFSKFAFNWSVQRNKKKHENMIYCIWWYLYQPDTESFYSLLTAAVTTAEPSLDHCCFQTQSRSTVFVSVA